MIFKRLRVDPVFEHPPFVIVRARAQLFLLIGAHHPPFILIPLFVAVSTTPSGTSLYQSKCSLIWRFEISFEDTLIYLSVLVIALAVIRFATQSNHASAFELQLDQPRLAHTPFVPSERSFFCMFGNCPAAPDAPLLPTNHTITQNIGCQYPSGPAQNLSYQETSPDSRS